MLTNWFAQPAGNRSSVDEGKIDNDDDTQVMEPDQGNGKLRNTRMAGEGEDDAWHDDVIGVLGSAYDAAALPRRHRPPEYQREKSRRMRNMVEMEQGKSSSGSPALQFSRTSFPNCAPARTSVASSCLPLFSSPEACWRG
jgi:hypothetical protein